MTKEAMKLALEALEGLEALLLSMGLTHLIVYGDAEKAITALQKALAEQPAQQEPVAWLTEERYAEMHTPKWTPKIQQVFSKDGILESQTIQYAPQSKPVSYPPAQRTWVGLTDEERIMCRSYDPEEAVAKTEAKLKEKNT